MTIIRLEKLNKIFGSGDKIVQALKDICIDISKGELIAIVGSSGSGKSTLLNTLGLLDEPSSGEYYLNDINVAKLSFNEKAKLRNKHFGFVVQNFALIKDYKVRSNIEIPLEYAKIKKLERKIRVEKICSIVGIEDKIDKYPNELSGGQCQRVAIARALINNPEIILADEPTGSLDSKTGQEIIDIFKKLNKEGKTVIIVTHDKKIAEQCNKIIYIEDGQIKI